MPPPLTGQAEGTDEAAQRVDVPIENNRDAHVVPRSAGGLVDEGLGAQLASERSARIRPSPRCQGYDATGAVICRTSSILNDPLMRCGLGWGAAARTVENEVPHERIGKQALALTADPRGGRRSMVSRRTALLGDTGARRQEQPEEDRSFTGEVLEKLAVSCHQGP